MTLNLSKITIRKDLDYLQSKDLLIRTHGGALPAQAGALSDPTIQEKGELHHEEKVKIAKAAAAMVSDGQCIILDSGTTTTEIAREILSLPPSHRHHQCAQYRRRSGAQRL